MRYLSSATSFSLLGIIVLGISISISHAPISTLPEQLIGQSSSGSSIDSTGDKPSPPRGSDRRQDA
ncbi:MAG: hypothetical protein HC916_01470 [Coleofasciculaceae cyanobacterium SM2_1_6]|nr:hypothetical protein [Coleofasciculaceae cyanobacterium SM2_1_6]